ncbi:hypothetical protein QP027_11225 [Corynebacterium breve]|uniref:Uncharacterized protein n=1 Tax=Corynebacterium breve TaxID=3049799 RepID=A0ABY8VHE7_9CORY|nr:hypothetical protein [Corynebacterium breve]WIM67639.1 hypothetical protein QP027_11225 [Corynebacterium breve]
MDSGNLTCDISVREMRCSSPNNATFFEADRAVWDEYAPTLTSWFDWRA